MNRIDPKSVDEAFSACTWGNTTETAQDWLDALQGEDDAVKRRIFEKLFAESPKGEHILLLFDSGTIGRYLKAMDRPLRRSYAEKRRKVWRYLYCGVRESIPELDWIVHK
jgi:hypothetical protein